MFMFNICRIRCIACKQTFHRLIELFLYCIQHMPDESLEHVVIVLILQIEIFADSIYWSCAAESKERNSYKYE